MILAIASDAHRRGDVYSGHISWKMRECEHQGETIVLNRIKMCG